MMAGKNVTHSGDLMTRVDEQYLFNRLRTPKPNVEVLVRQLRILRKIDPAAYSRQKRQLPYIVCATFEPAIRRKEHFAYTDSFILDIDNLSSKSYDLHSLRSQLQSDDRVVMCFVSPGEDGLKLLFRLSERCHDPGVYSVFYKSFIQKFSTRYGLEQVIDSCTSDVSRACFVSVDPEVYFNPDATPIRISDYVNTSDTFVLLQQKHDIETRPTPAQSEDTTEPHPEPVTPIDPDDEVMARIKEVLFPKQAKPERPPVYVPEMINEVIADLTAYVEKTGVVVSEQVPIQYGMKFRLRMTRKEAELNLFYGKRGFTVVVSPRRGTDPEFNDLAAELFRSFFFV